MVFSGMAFSTLLGIFGAVAAVTVLFYILKLRRRPVSVPFSPIWQRILKDKEATHWFSQLKRLLSLLLQLALLALLVLALGDPRLSDSWFEGRNIVVLVDTSASMQAKDVEPTRLELGKRKLRELVNGLTGTDRMLIAEMGATPRAVSTMTEDVAELKRAVGDITAKDTRADFERGLRFALDSLRGLPRGEVILISDGSLGDQEYLNRKLSNLPELNDVKLSFLPVGEGGDNIAITAFSVRRYPLDKSRYEVLLEVTNTKDKPIEAELTLIGDGETVDVSSISLGPNERLPRFYHDLSGASRTLEAKVALKGDSVDILEADNHAYALMPERRRVRVLVVSQGNTYLQAALLLDEYLEVTVVTPEETLPNSEFDVTILDAVAPELSSNHGARLYLNPPAGTPLEYKGKKEINNFGFDTWDKKSPFLRWMALGNVQALRGHAFKTEKSDHVVGASELGPILVSGQREGKRFLALGFDPRDSDFVLRVGWPLFLLNAINTFASEDTSYISSYRTGEVWNVPTPSGLEAAALRTPSGDTETIPVKNGNAVYFGENAGFYELLNEDDEVISAFAANLSDVTESTLDPVTELALGTKQAQAVEGFSTRVRLEIWLYLILAALALSALEWFSYHRRVTV